MSDIPQAAIDAAAEAIGTGMAIRQPPATLALGALEAAALPLAIAENLARLGVDPPEWDMYANALEQTPGVLPMLRACTTRAELDKLTEDGD